MDSKNFELGGRGRGGGREEGGESCLCWASVNRIVDTTIQVFLPFVLSALVSRVPELKRAVGLGEKGVQRGVEKVAVVFWMCAVPSLGIGLSDGGFNLVPLLLVERSCCSESNSPNVVHRWAQRLRTCLHMTLMSFDAQVSACFEGNGMPLLRQ